MRHLEYFAAVASERSFTAAAKRLQVVQSAVSAGVKALEHELAARLIERTSRRVEVTEAGSALLPYAMEVLDQAEAGRQAVAQVVGGISGTVRLGVQLPDAGMDVSGAIARMRKLHPGVRVVLSTCAVGAKQMAASVAHRELDLALIWPMTERMADVDLVPVLSRKLVLIAAANSPLAGFKRVPMVDIGKYDFIDSPTGFGNRELTDHMFAEAGVKREIALEVSNPEDFPAYVRAGLAIGFVPHDTFVRMGDGIIACEVRRTTPKSLLALALPAGRPVSRGAGLLAEQIRLLPA